MIIILNVIQKETLIVPAHLKFPNERHRNFVFKTGVNYLHGSQTTDNAQ